MKPNPLRVWMKQTGVKPSDVAKLFFVTPPEIHRISQDGYWPPLKTALRIFALTDGAVAPQDFIELKLRSMPADMAEDLKRINKCGIQLVAEAQERNNVEKHEK